MPRIIPKLPTPDEYDRWGEPPRRVARALADAGYTCYIPYARSFGDLARYAWRAERSGLLFVVWRERCFGGGEQYLTACGPEQRTPSRRQRTFRELRDAERAARVCAAKLRGVLLVHWPIKALLFFRKGDPDASNLTLTHDCWKRG